MRGRLVLVAVATLAMAGCEPDGDASIGEVQVSFTTTSTIPTTTTTVPPTTTTAAPTTTTVPPTTTTARPRATTTTAAAGPRCHPSYEGACLPPDASDVDCAGGSGNGPEYTSARNFSVVGPDEYDLDRDGDGVACES